VRPNPAQVHDEINGLVQTRPAEVFIRIAGEQGRILTPGQQRVLALRAVDKLALKVETGRQPLQDLAEVRSAGQNAPAKDPVLRKSLELMARVAERRVLAKSLREVDALGQRGQWDEAAGRADDWLPRLQDAPLGPGEPADLQARADVRDALTEVSEVGREARALNRLGQGLKAAGQDRPAETVASLRQVDLKSLPEKLRGPALGLRGQAELRLAAAGRWEKAPDVAGLKGSASALKGGLRDVPGADAKDVKELMQDLAVKAFLEGHAEAFRDLLPADGPPEHADALLRDLKALALGGGKVETWPAERALPAEPGRGGEAPRGPPPPGLRPLIPEGAAEAWRPPVKESADADLPAIEKVAQTGKVLRTRAEADLEPARAAHGEKARKARGRLEAVAHNVRALEEANRKRAAEVEAALARKLTPGERIRVAVLAGQNQTNGQILIALGGPAPQPANQQDDEKFVAEVEKLLGRPPTAGERAEALRMKRGGLTAAQAADDMKGRELLPNPVPVEEEAEAVARLLGRKLTDSERIMIPVMGQQGKTPAEMAAILAKLPPVAPKP
jgi:hypothetical protein